MPAGFQVFNDSNTVQVDQDYLCLQFVAKGSQTLTTRMTAAGIMDPGVASSVQSQTGNAWVNPLGTGAPSFAGDGLVAFRARGGGRVGVGYTNTGLPVFIGDSPTAGPIVDWWQFGRAAVRSSGAGLEVYDASGNLVFSDAQRPMKLEAVANDVNIISAPSLTGPNGDWAICTGATWPSVFSFISQGGEWHYVEGIPMWEAPSNTGFGPPLMRNAFARKNSQIPNGLDYSQAKATMLLVDVAGL
jgi:hypothetical protein